MRQLKLLGLLLVLVAACHHQEGAGTEGLTSSSKTQAVTANIRLGVAYLKQGDRPRAKRKFLTALNVEPSSPEANAAMAYYLETTGDIQAARGYYKKAMTLAPKDGAQLNNYGGFLCRQGSYKEADWYFLRAVSDLNYLNSASAYENAGLCAAKIPDYNKAAWYYSKALVQDPSRKRVLRALIHLEKKLNHPQKAEAYLARYQDLANRK